MNILYCDDDYQLRKLVSDHLTVHGHRVSIASCGYDALALLKNSTYDIVVTDYQMESGGGGMLAHFCGEHAIRCVIATGMDPACISAYLPKETTVIEKFNLFAALSQFVPDAAG